MSVNVSIHRQVRPPVGQKCRPRAVRRPWFARHLAAIVLQFAGVR